MYFVPEPDLHRMLAHAHRRRRRALVESGHSSREAFAITDKEFAIYDVIETDARGYVRISGLDLTGPDSQKP